ncbi:5-methyltetrahydrofolate--homocysteine methyltransferase [Clostridia bacterium]|nr:5-methyltetrahydrofolate--homocysteine methyltransferase [Clostridia bacterium]
MDFKTLLSSDKIILIDGAFGTEIQRLHKEPFSYPEQLNETHPDLIKGIVRSYADAGSDIVCANTFSANRFKLKKHGKSVDEEIGRAVRIAKEAVAGRDVLIALDVTTLGQLLEPAGKLTFEEAYEAYAEIMVAGEKHGADVVIIETMTDLLETKAALLALKENTSLPVICSMTFEKNGRTFTGTPVAAMAMTLEALGADVLGINCSLGPAEVAALAEELLTLTTLPVMIKPNAGLPDPETGEFSLSAKTFAAQIAPLAAKGAKILGGCCGTNPEFIRELSIAIKGLTYVPRKITPLSAVCSGTKAVIIDEPRIIGERINPTGKKAFKKALKENDIDYVLGQALEQIGDGADILDVNVGLPEIDEKEVMVKVVRAIQAVCDAPLQIDSTKPDVLEAALRVYNGKPIVNSVNGEDSVLDTILPIVKKYGAAVVGLTLDSNGIPKDANGRIAIAEKILSAAIKHGIRREDVYIDCLTLTASAEQAAVSETLSAVRYVKEKLGLKTVLGVSNISFGLPNRETVNHAFLAMALNCGLDLPIMNPNVAAMTGTVLAYKVLSNTDKNAKDFIEAYADERSPKDSPKAEDMTIDYAIRNGLKADGAKITASLLSRGEAPMDIIENSLIPSLDKVGTLFERNKLFLPQLILSAEAAGACFDVIKKSMAKSGVAHVSKGKILMATVRGDIHDIGKNIVKTLLENYGYEVVDLGKDVPEKLIADTALAQSIKLIGLSALMTTTLPAMELTIKLLRESVPNCVIMVGGAVLNADYAKKIGADFYSNDAKGAIDIAKKVFS